MGQNDTSGFLKISELAKLTGVNSSTIKYYIKEGLIKPAYKTGSNMSYYSPECVQRISLIKKLQKERYYPLSVIKHLLNGTSNFPVELDLLDAIHKVDVKSFSQTYSPAEAAKKTGLTRKQIAILCDNCLVESERSGNRQTFSLLDIRVMFAVKCREDAGIPFDQTVRSMVIYNKALRQAAEEDVDSFISSAIMVVGHLPDEIARMIRVSDETLDEFVTVRRMAFNRKIGSERIELLERFALSLQKFLNGLQDIFLSAAEDERAERCRNIPASSEKPEDALAAYALMMNGSFGKLSDCIRCCAAANTYFSRANFTDSPDEDLFFHQCLYLGWMTLAPPQLGCGDRAAEAKIQFLAYSEACPQKGRSVLADKVITLLKSLEY